MIRRFPYQRGNRCLEEFGFKNPVSTGEMKQMANEKNKNPDYDVVVGIKTGENTFWQKIGAAWKKEKGISIKLNALPLQDNIMLFVHKEKSE
jgi:hypothetical protein